MSQCFFFVEALEEDENDGIIRSLCLKHGRTIPNSWFYEGEFGPWVIKCHICGEVIYEPKETPRAG